MPRPSSQVESGSLLRPRGSRRSAGQPEPRPLSEPTLFAPERRQRGNHAEKTRRRFYFTRSRFVRDPESGFEQARPKAAGLAQNLDSCLLCHTCQEDRATLESDPSARHAGDDPRTAYNDTVGAGGFSFAGVSGQKR